jgi:hypothetical protein
MNVRAFGGLFADRMYMARCELSGVPRVRVYEVDPVALYVPDYNKPRARVIPREERAWHGTAERKLCPPGFAAFGGTQALALRSLMRVMQEHRDTGKVDGLGVAIRVVLAAIELRSKAGAVAHGI